MTTRGNNQGRDAQAWLQAKARLLPNLLPQSPPWVRSVFQHAWAPMKALAEAIQPLPADLWPFLLGRDGGMAAVCPGESRYVPGPATIGMYFAMKRIAISLSSVTRPRSSNSPPPAWKKSGSNPISPDADISHM